MPSSCKAVVVQLHVCNCALFVCQVSSFAIILHFQFACVDEHLVDLGDIESHISDERVIGNLCDGSSHVMEQSVCPDKEWIGPFFVDCLGVGEFMFVLVNIHTNKQLIKRLIAVSCIVVYLENQARSL
jgi:hypothetical protein